MNENTEGRLTTADVANRQREMAEHTDGHSQSTVDSSISLLGNDKASGYSERWQSIQGRFVDEPQDSVKEADSLVAEVIQELATKFAEQRKGLEGRWSSGSEVSTEDLRQALQQYRSFFQRLLAA